MKLNTEQTQAVSHYEGPCIVTAVPGSGKTQVLTSRAISLVHDKGIDPRNILCLTFTNKAADEMKDRISSALGEKSKNIWISTFHRLCLAILRKHGSFVNLPPGFSVYSSKEQDELMTKLARMEGHETDRKSIFKLTKAVNDFREDIVDYQQHIEELNPVEVSIVQQYQEALDDLKAVDFSGMLYKAWLILQKSEAVINSLTKRFKFVLVDEFQDTNHIQYDIVKQIGSHGNVFVVGDLSQAIYGWRGAKPENLRRFSEDFSSVATVTLPSNYRSYKPILEAAQTLIRRNDDSKDVILKAERGEHGPLVRIRDFMDSEDEASDVASRIESRAASKYDWKDFAILYRVNSLSRSPEMALRSRGIPYKVIGGFSFFDRAEIKTTLSYLSVIVNPFDTINFARALTNPKRGIGPDSIGKLEKMHESHEGSIVDMCQKAEFIPKMSSKAQKKLVEFGQMVNRWTQKHNDGKPLHEIAEGILKESGYMDYVKTIDIDESNDKSRFENVEEMIVGIAEYEERKPGSRFADYLHSIHLVANDTREDDDANTVKLLTMHSAKGLEWPCVEIIGVERGTIPHAKAEMERGIEEERRLLYVAMTRAQDQLSMSYCHYRRRRKAGRSCFLDEIE